MKPDQTRVGALLIDTISLLCRNGLNFTNDIKVQGLIGITVDGNDIFLVHLNETLTENQSIEHPLSKNNVSTEPATVQPSKHDEGNPATEKPNIRRSGMASSSVLRHRYGSLPIGTQMRRRTRQLGMSLSRMKYQPRALETGTDFSAKSVDLPPAASDDEKPDCSNYAEIKTEFDEEDHYQETAEEQNDVILVESEEGAIDQGDVVPSVSESRSFLKEEEFSEFSEGTNKAIFMYDNSYRQFTQSSSIHDQDRNDIPGAFSCSSRYADNGIDDMKPIAQMQSSAETWTMPEMNWQLAKNSRLMGSKYGTSSSCQPHETMNLEDTDHLGSGLLQHSVMPRTATKDRDLLLKSYGRGNAISNRIPLTSFSDQRYSSLTMASAANRRDSSAAFGRQLPAQMTSSSLGHTKTTYTVTKYVCNICDATFNHHCTLLTHQVRKHGRQKNARRGRPSTFSGHKTEMSF